MWRRSGSLEMASGKGGVSRFGRTPFSISHHGQATNNGFEALNFKGFGTIAQYPVAFLDAICNTSTCHDNITFSVVESCCSHNLSCL